MTDMSAPQISPEFTRLCQGASGIDLVEVLLEIAADVYPRLDGAACRREIAGFALQAQSVTGGEEERLRRVSEFLYDVEGFRGDEDDYYDPRNSYLNEVLRRRKGLPITLGILYMAVARPSGLDLFGVAAPGHFMLGCRFSGGTLYVDPFFGGEILDRASCVRRICKAAGPMPGDDFHLEPAGSLEIVARVLRNLKLACARRGDWRRALPVQRRLVTLLPDYSSERRDLGLILLKAGCGWEALRCLKDYVAKHPAETESLEHFLRAAQRAAAEMN